MTDNLNYRVAELERLVRSLLAARGTPTTGADHGGLAGLSDDDHTQYLLADGSRELSANWDAGGYSILTDVDLRAGGGISVGGASNDPVAGGIDLAEQASVLATPSSGYGRLFGSTSAPYWVNDAGISFGAFSDRIFLPAYTLRPGSALSFNPIPGSGYPYQGWQMPPAGTRYLDVQVPLPFSWGGRPFIVYVYWSPEDTGSGNVTEQVQIWTSYHGGPVPSTPTSYYSNTTAVPTKNYLNVSQFPVGTFATYAAERMIGIRYIRYGDDAYDTYTGDIIVFGIEVRVFAA